MTPAPCHRNMTLDATALHLAAIVDSSDDAIMSEDLAGTIEAWNSAAEQMFGYTAAEAVGRSIRLIVPEERYDEERSILGRVKSGQSVKHFETVRCAKGGRRVPVLLTVSPIRTPGGA